MKLSASNQLPGKVEEIELGNVMAHVVVGIGDNEVDSEAPSSICIAETGRRPAVAGAHDGCIRIGRGR